MEDMFIDETDVNVLFFRLGILSCVTVMICLCTRDVEPSKETLTSLYDACLMTDLSELSEMARSTFGFDHCFDETEEENLLNLYQDVLFNHLLRTEKSREHIFRRLRIAVQGKQLVTMIRNIYSQELPCVYHEWFENNSQRLFPSQS
jgi:hypothetical protein